jgi:hypothetical protein
LPFFEGDGWGGGGNGFSAGGGLWDGSTGGGGAGPRALSLDDSGGALEVEAAAEAGGIRLKIDSVDCFWFRLALGCGRGGVANKGGLRGRTRADFLVLDTTEASRWAIPFPPRSFDLNPEFTKRLVPLICSFFGIETEEAAESGVEPVSNTDVKFMSAGGLYATLGFD